MHEPKCGMKFVFIVYLLRVYNHPNNLLKKLIFMKGNYEFSILFFRQALSVLGHCTEFRGPAQGDGSPPLYGPLSVVHQLTDETAGMESEVLC